MKFLWLRDSWRRSICSAPLVWCTFHAVQGHIYNLSARAKDKYADSITSASILVLVISTYTSEKRFQQHSFFLSASRAAFCAVKVAALSKTRPCVSPQACNNDKSRKGLLYRLSWTCSSAYAQLSSSQYATPYIFQQQVYFSSYQIHVTQIIFFAFV